MITSARQDDALSGGPGVILVNTKYLHNVAAAIRAASCFDVTSLVWTGSRVDPPSALGFAGSRISREPRALTALPELGVEAGRLN
jgi:hypothetical protein